MTVIGCTAACGAAGYKLSGMEYASKITILILEQRSSIRALLTRNLSQVNVTAITLLPKARPT
jgi:hypothetical protein